MFTQFRIKKGSTELGRDFTIGNKIAKITSVTSEILALYMKFAALMKAMLY